MAEINTLGLAGNEASVNEQKNSSNSFIGLQKAFDDAAPLSKESLSQNKVHNSSDNTTDNSDIEILSEEKNTSSDSIEVLERSANEVEANNWNGVQKRQYDFLESNVKTGNIPVPPKYANDSGNFSPISVSSVSTISQDPRFIESPRHDTWSPVRSVKSATDQSLSDSPKRDSSTPEISQQSSNTASPSMSPRISAAEANIHDRPDSLSLPRPLQYYERQKLIKKESLSSQSEFSSRSSSMDALIEQASSTPLHTQGSVSKEGDMMTFVADDLADMIKRSSPMSRSRTESSVSSWARSGAHSPSSMSSSTSGWDSSASSITGYSYSGISSTTGEYMSKQTDQGSSSMVTQSPDDVPLVDPRALMDLEIQALKTAQSLHKMSTTLNTNLHKMSGLTLGCLSAYLMGVDNTCDAVDSSIKSMYALMAKCEELSKTMYPLYDLKNDIKEIKRLLDLFEAQMNRDDR